MGTVSCWGNSNVGQLGRGDNVNDRIPTPVSLGAGAVAVALAVGSLHNCVLLDNATIKCWGYNLRGQLGLGDMNNRGDGVGEMGDALPTVNLGVGVRPIGIYCGGFHTCALLDDGRTKCWGQNSSGQLGRGNRNSIGDHPNEMGDALATIDLGGLRVLSLATGRNHTCALLEDGTVKCWGHNQHGQLGLNDFNDRGDGPGEMGNALRAVDLGPGLRVLDVQAVDHTCAIVEGGRLKCWGLNGWGQLGLGDFNNRGDSGGEVGAVLPFVDLGAGRQVISVATGAYHTCAVLNGNTIKCWGQNNPYGQLGLGDVIPRGDQPGEMGDNLPEVQIW
jgi:alpha-tubulin suppressor-like RCC1 family protein